MPARFKLLVGQHEQADPDWTPPHGVTLKLGRYVDKNGETAVDPDTGKMYRAPTKKYKAGDVVVSDQDLVKKFGDQKFQYLSGSVKGTAPSLPKSKFPNDQVSSGVPEDQSPQAPAGGPPVTTGDPDQSVLREGEGDDPRTMGGTEEDIGGERLDARKQAAERSPADDAYGDLTDKTVAELKEIAEAEEVDLKGAHKKDEIIKALRKGKAK